MQAKLMGLIVQCVAGAAFALLAVAAHATPAPLPAGEALVAAVQAAAPAATPRPACLPAPAQLPAAETSKAGNGEQVALGTTHCWWACYPGSGCEYVCRFYPE